MISEGAARALTYMMTEVLNSGTGGRARLDDREAAGKTGTTNLARDAWFVGFTADYVVGVWMGYDDNSPLTGVTGGGLPAEIWHEVMTRINEGVDARPLLTEVPESTYVPVDPSTTEGAVLPEDVPYFDDPNAPSYDGGFYEQPLPEAYIAPLPDRRPEADLAEQILQEVLGTAGN